MEQEKRQAIMVFLLPSVISALREKKQQTGVAIGRQIESALRGSK